jgi:hypothetical protein
VVHRRSAETTPIHGFQLFKVFKSVKIGESDNSLRTLFLCGEVRLAALVALLHASLRKFCYSEWIIQKRIHREGVEQVIRY